MGLMYSTVIGYMVVLGFTAAFIMYYLSKVAFHAADAEKIDPKPDNKF